jgi:8-oxo-dGTP pyrophosphatase MutT (NUDIX family)
VSPAIARPSASVILVRDAPRGLETFMVRRHARSPVAPHAYVFPGGTVRADDAAFQSADAEHLANLLSRRSDTPVEPERARDYFACALRELFEEAGVLLATDANGSLLGVAQDDVGLQEQLEATRLALQANQVSLAGALQRFDVRPAFEALVPFSHWVTPDAMAARFDARFFVAHMPDGQEALHCTIETSEGAWLRPADVLEGDYHVVYATAQHLRRLKRCDSVTDLLDFARRKPIRRVHPTVTEGADGLSVYLPPDLADNW